MLQVSIGQEFTTGEGASGVEGSGAFNTLGGFLATILPNVMIVANIILFFLILFGGFMMIANSGNPEKQEQGAKVLTSSIMGFLIIFGAYWIMQILGLITGYGVEEIFPTGNTL